MPLVVVVVVVVVVEKNEMCVVANIPPCRSERHPSIAVWAGASAGSLLG
jgi:hypothetical protein